MAVTIAQTLNSVTVKQLTMIATADGDTVSPGAITWTTPFTAVPLYAVITPILVAGGLSAWVVVTMTATQINVTKTGVAAGSGNAGIQAVLTVFLTPVAFPLMSHPVQGVNPWALPI